jgi:hypothetical protein
VLTKKWMPQYVDMKIIVIYSPTIVTPTHKERTNTAPRTEISLYHLFLYQGTELHTSPKLKLYTEVL